MRQTVTWMLSLALLLAGCGRPPSAVGSEANAKLKPTAPAQTLAPTPTPAPAAPPNFLFPAVVPTPRESAVTRSSRTLATWKGYAGTIVTYSRWQERSIGNRLAISANRDGRLGLTVHETNLVNADGATIEYWGTDELLVRKGWLFRKTVSLNDDAWAAWAPLVTLISWAELLEYLKLPGHTLTPVGTRVVAGVQAEALRHRSPELDALGQSELVGFDPQTFTPRFVQREDARGIVHQVIFETMRATY